jgi:hypothetical protein
MGPRSSVIRRGTMLQAGRSRDSIPDEVTGFFNWPNPSSRTMALESTQSLTEINTRNLSGGKGQPERKADNLTAYKMLEPRRFTTLCASTACSRDSFNTKMKIQFIEQWTTVRAQEEGSCSIYFLYHTRDKLKTGVFGPQLLTLLQ